MPMIELVSIHIPKTAGSSFAAVLESVYQETLHRTDDRAEYADLPTSVPEAARAIHGHFPARTFARLAPDAKLVVWLRNPIDRLLSHYRYWLHAEPHGSPAHDEFLRTRPSFTSFARSSLWHPTVEEYLDGVPLEEFAFVGLVEHFEADLRAFLGTRRHPVHGTAVPRLNVTPGLSRRPPPSELAIVADLIRGEVTVYERACALRARRIQARDA